MIPLSGKVASHVLRTVLGSDRRDGEVLAIHGLDTRGAVADMDYSLDAMCIVSVAVTFAPRNGSPDVAIFSADEIGGCRVAELRDLVFSRRQPSFVPVGVLRD